MACGRPRALKPIPDDSRCSAGAAAEPRGPGGLGESVVL